MEYIVDDKKLDAFTFIAFVKQVWQGNYDIEKTQCALSQTINITAYENEALIGCLRILTDGYYFGTPIQNFPGRSAMQNAPAFRLQSTKTERRVRVCEFQNRKVSTIL